MLEQASKPVHYKSSIMSKLEIVSLQKKGDLTKPDDQKVNEQAAADLARVMAQPVFMLANKETNLQRVKREISEQAAEEAKERKRQKQLEKAEVFANWVHKDDKKLRLVVRHNTHRDGILLEYYETVHTWNEKCKLLAWRLATTPGGKNDPDWYPTFKQLQRARKKRDKAISKQQRAWEYAKKGLNWRKEHEKQCAERDKKLREQKAAARQARRKALKDAKRLDVLEHEKRLLQLQLAAAQAKNTQWARVEEGRRRFMEAHGKALEVPGATSPK